jgi:hypothetical protein
MKDHVYYLASDAMKGRNTPSPGLDSSAAYIAREFRSYGIKPVGSDNSFYQKFNILRTSLAETNQLILKTEAGETEFEIKYDFVPLHNTANRKLVDLPVLFAGYGISAPEFGYDDYATVDVQGKVAFIFTGEPQKTDTTSVFDGSKETDHSKLRVKIENAMDHGALGLLLVSTPDRRFRRPPNSWPSLLRYAPESAVPLSLEQKAEQLIVCMQLGRESADALLEGTGFTLEEVFQKIDTDLTPQSFEIPGKTVTMETNLKSKKFKTQNVVGYWEGSDPVLKNELIVIGAHYDHVGTRNDTIVYNGADDNASGTAGVIEIAEAFTECNSRPKRSLLFITFSGEEKGLFGSRYYTDNPLFPIENTVAMLNMDMISRNDTNEVAIIGSKTSNTIKEISDACNANIGMDIEYTEQWFLQSDHYPYYKKGVPVLFYNTKDTPDLHRPTDDPEKIIPEKMARIGKLVFSTAWEIANRTERPDYIKVR